MMFSDSDKLGELKREDMKEYKPHAITELVNDCNHNKTCYIVCTIAGFLTDYGRVDTATVRIARDSFSFQAGTGLVSLKEIEWKNLRKLGDQYDINIGDDYGLNIAFYL